METIKRKVASWLCKPFVREYVRSQIGARLTSEKPDRLASGAGAAAGTPVYRDGDCRPDDRHTLSDRTRTVA